MYKLNSELEGYEAGFVNVYSIMKEEGFSLGGGWEYDYGCVDKALDERNTVWLRVPFEVTHGTFEGDTDESDAVIQLSTPFVLRHLYEDGLDQDARVGVATALFNQFQSPVDKDAELDSKWIAIAEEQLNRLEQRLKSL